ncbi:MAG TPA: cyclodeaminase/cyclohydrolase family protein [Bacillota bacterium]|nr:cyclodeaminase/cyclohydrolase family protein [Bacillota bacterium]HNT02145.1 cyclodeaminase/cyclohydrolase family protein [Bacillota bacterium]HPA54300.1 cyclodeaminase/cyclohydrolase family protein [Bacillota bacterium]HPX68597.1 cyclodeaminase/cyclohydrolase family protein [Bacillota bacterium]HQA66004.1 cyclodeaminase/cyclohydrolase family protein [Bacillota bacterium]
MSLLMDMTLRDYSDVLASSEPAPGGGSTAALSGVLGAALTMMVVNLSVGKKNYENLNEKIKAKFMEEAENVKALQKELSGLVDEDTKAFNKFMEAVKLPKDTEEQNQLRGKKMQEASLYALQVPIKTAECCFRLLENQGNIARYGNRNAVSDVGVGALLTLSGLEGAILNVNINLSGIEDEAVRSEAYDKCRRLSAEGRKLHSEILDIVNLRIG